MTGRKLGTVLCGIGLLWMAGTAWGGEADLPEAKAVPDMQVLPLPHDQASFQWRGTELTRFHFAPTLDRPFLYPVIGPGGRSYTRMGHPHDPITHSHHNSVWVSHEKVNGVNFWSDGHGTRIVCQYVERYEDGPERAWLICLNHWKDPQGKTLMVEHRRIEVTPMKNGEWFMAIDLQLEAPGDEPVELGETPFGPIGVRMAKTIGVADGGGRILNSEGLINEKAIFRKPTCWVDYSGPITADQTGGITLMDYPKNPGHPAPFHVRSDGWMGACLTFRGPMTIEPGNPLRLRYGLWVHANVPTRREIAPVWERFAASEWLEMVRRKR